MMFEYKQVIVVRSDLEMSVGKIASQVGHAAVTAAELARKEFNDWWKAWFDGGQCKIVVKVNSELELLSLMDEARALNLPTALIQDRGLTEVPAGTITCLGIGPGPAELVDKVTEKLPLL
jgi:PTH2 family peptidyl-tRNA hydrolase